MFVDLKLGRAVRMEGLLGFFFFFSYSNFLNPLSLRTQHLCPAFVFGVALLCSQDRIGQNKTVVMVDFIIHACTLIVRYPQVFYVL